MPISVDRLAAHSTVRTGMWSHVRLRPREGPDTLVADVSVIDADGAVALELEGLRFARAAAAALKREDGGQVGSWLYGVEWRPAPLPASTETAVRPRRGALSIAEAWKASGPGLPTRSGAATTRCSVEIDRLAADYIVSALRRLGGRLGIGDHVTLSGLQESLRILPRYRGLLRRLLEILAEDGILGTTAEGWTVIRDVERVIVDAEAGAHPVLARHADSPELALVARCGPELAGVLQGTIDPLDLLFPGGSIELARRLYRESPAAKACNALVGDAVSRLIAAAPDRPLRILEVGGGTGGTTAALLPLLPPDRTHYTFTDVVADVRRRGGGGVRGLPVRPRPGARHRALTRDPGAGRPDLRRDPRRQRRCTRRQTCGAALAHCHELLAPDGLLVLVEVTRAAALGGPHVWPHRWMVEVHRRSPAFVSAAEPRGLDRVFAGGAAHPRSPAVPPGPRRESSRRTR